MSTCSLLLRPCQFNIFTKILVCLYKSSDRDSLCTIGILFHDFILSVFFYSMIEQVVFYDESAIFHTNCFTSWTLSLLNVNLHYYITIFIFKFLFQDWLTYICTAWLTSISWFLSCRSDFYVDIFIYFIIIVRSIGKLMYVYISERIK